MTWKVLEDAEWWCINAEYNKAKLPNLTPLRLQAQEVINFSVGSRLLICHGSVSVNDVIKDPGSTIKIVTEPGLDIRAETDVYALKFDL
jgi:TATA-box binding protein (TBP) (component of TFIID and TFIIIB)